MGLRDLASFKGLKGLYTWRFMEVLKLLIVGDISLSRIGRTSTRQVRRVKCVSLCVCKHIFISTFTKSPGLPSRVI